MVCPVFLGPVNLVYWVVIFSSPSSFFGSSFFGSSALSAMTSLVDSSLAATGTGLTSSFVGEVSLAVSLMASLDTFSLAGFAGSTFCSVSAGFAFTGFSATALGFSSAGFAGAALGSRSIFPTAFGFFSAARALITSCCAFSRSSFSCSSFSCSKRRFSFSFLFSSLISAEASLLDLSVSNSSNRIL